MDRFTGLARPDIETAVDRSKPWAGRLRELALQISFDRGHLEHASTGKRTVEGNDMKWADYESRVRDTARNIWSRPCKPQRVGGVNIDGIVRLDEDIQILVEMTENRTLGKVREDIVKLQTAKAALIVQGIAARCFCVVNGEVTQAMKDAGEPHRIQVLSITDFSQIFFAFDEYKIARDSAPFGSSINPLTGAPDETEYVPVGYIAEGHREFATTDTIAAWLRDGRKIILLGEYGTGKSRCIREVFRSLSEQAAENFCYPVAINLRESWGLLSKEELLRRHVSSLGFENNLEASVVRAYRAGSLALLFDGFDEIGSQAWSNDSQRLKSIRAKALEGIKDAILNNKGGVLLTGREHYFPTSDELFSATGLDRQKTIVLRSKNEFSDTELLDYFEKRNISVDIPEWLPRRPLICQTISDLVESDFDKMFGSGGDEVEFWNHFIDVLCERDAKINILFDKETIKSIFIYLARITRTRSLNVGPISLADLQAAFEASTGAAPVEEASVMLQRLPSLGRLSAESNDRQFVDVYILDGLRAKDVVKACTAPEAEFSAVASTVWTHSLDDLGQRVLAKDNGLSEKSKLSLAERCQRAGNRVLACDLISALTRNQPSSFDFNSFQLDNGTFAVLNLRERTLHNLTIAHSYIGELVLPAKEHTKINLIKCVCPRVIGVSSPAGLPYWIDRLEAESFDSVASVSRIRKLGLSPAHELLTAVIRKTFFQPGSGRKEEALMRGLGSPAVRNLSRKLLNMLVTEGVLDTFRGDHGTVYTPVRSHTRRMQAILNELASSSDQIWKAAEHL